MFSYFKSGTSIASYTFYVFENLPSLNLVVREVRDADWDECGISNSNASGHPVGKFTLGRGAKRLTITDHGSMKVTRSIATQENIKLLLKDGSDKNNEKTLLRLRTLNCDRYLGIDFLECYIIVVISDARQAEMKAFL